MKGRLLILALAGATLAACSDPINIKASFEVKSDTLTASALTGTPATALSALNTVAPALVRPDVNAVFDIVFDIDGAGDVVIYPSQRIVSPAGGYSPGEIGLQVLADTEFDAVEEAPVRDYGDTAVVVGLRETVAIRSRNVYCAGQLRDEIYSKLEVLAADPTARTINFRLTVDPNCGFLSFAEGIPER